MTTLLTTVSLWLLMTLAFPLILQVISIICNVITTLMVSFFDFSTISAVIQVFPGLQGGLEALRTAGMGIAIVLFVIGIYQYFISPHSSKDSWPTMIARFLISLFMIYYSSQFIEYIMGLGNAIYELVLNAPTWQTASADITTTLNRLANRDPISVISIGSIANAVFNTTDLGLILCAVFIVILLYQMLKLWLRSFERYANFIIELFSFPLTASFAANATTMDTFVTYLRAVLSQYLILLMNVFFVKVAFANIFLGVLNNLYGGTNVITQFLYSMAFIKVAVKAEELVRSWGLQTLSSGSVLDDFSQMGRDLMIAAHTIGMLGSGGASPTGSASMGMFDKSGFGRGVERLGKLANHKPVSPVSKVLGGAYGGASAMASAVTAYKAGGVKAVVNEMKKGVSSGYKTGALQPAVKSVKNMGKANFSAKQTKEQNIQQKGNALGIDKPLMPTAKAMYHGAKNLLDPNARMETVNAAREKMKYGMNAARDGYKNLYDPNKKSEAVKSMTSQKAAVMEAEKRKIEANSTKPISHKGLDDIAKVQRSFSPQESNKMIGKTAADFANKNGLGDLQSGTYNSSTGVATQHYKNEGRNGAVRESNLYAYPLNGEHSYMEALEKASSKGNVSYTLSEGDEMVMGSDGTMEASRFAVFSNYKDIPKDMLEEEKARTLDPSTERSVMEEQKENAHQIIYDANNDYIAKQDPKTYIRMGSEAEGYAVLPTSELEQMVKNDTPEYEALRDYLDYEGYLEKDAKKMPDGDAITAEGLASLYFDTMDAQTKEEWAEAYDKQVAEDSQQNRSIGDEDNTLGRDNPDNDEDEDN